GSSGPPPSFSRCRVAAVLYPGWPFAETELSQPEIPTPSRCIPWWTGSAPSSEGARLDAAVGAFAASHPEVPRPFDLGDVPDDVARDWGFSGHVRQRGWLSPSGVVAGQSARRTTTVPRWRPNTGRSMTEITRTGEWETLGKHFQGLRDVHLRELFADDPYRGSRLTLEDDG